MALKKRVASFRSSLAREMREEQITSKSGSGKRTSAVYVYTKALNFLRPHMRLRATQDNMGTSRKRPCDKVSFIKVHCTSINTLQSFLNMQSDSLHCSLCNVACYYVSVFPLPRNLSLGNKILG